MSFSEQGCFGVAEVEGRAVVSDANARRAVGREGKSILIFYRA
jgi:hypothetical protein